MFARVFNSHIDTVKRGYRRRSSSTGDEIRTVFIQCVVRSCQIGRPCYRGLFEAAVAASCRIQGTDLIADKNGMTQQSTKSFDISKSSTKAIRYQIGLWKRAVKEESSETITFKDLHGGTRTLQ